MRLSIILNSLFHGKQYIVIACMQKSGSTFLYNILEELTGYKKASLMFASAQNEQELYLPKMLDAFWYESITQQHFRATHHNLYLLKLFRIQPIILVRNIFDIVVSLRDHFINESLKNPTCYVTGNFLHFDKEKQLDFVIDLAMPWFFNFFVSWDNVVQNDAIKVIWLSYEELINDKVNCINQIMEFYRIKRTRAELRDAIKCVEKKRSNRLNIGVAGRGMKDLNKDQQNRITNISNHYPYVDFSKIGLK